MTFELLAREGYEKKTLILSPPCASRSSNKLYFHCFAKKRAPAFRRRHFLLVFFQQPFTLQHMTQRIVRSSLQAEARQNRLTEFQPLQVSSSVTAVPIMNILCIGDSLTYGYGIRRAETWCALASQRTGHTFINRGVNGATTGEMAEQELGGDELFVMGGLNNLFMGMDVTVPLADIRSICSRASGMGIRPVVGIPMQISDTVSEAWCEGPVDMDFVRAGYAEFADALVRQCRTDGTDFIDFRPVIDAEHLSFDGIHLNKSGHERMAQVVAAYWNARQR